MVPLRRGLSSVGFSAVSPSNASSEASLRPGIKQSEMDPLVRQLCSLVDSPFPLRGIGQLKRDPWFCNPIWMGRSVDQSLSTLSIHNAHLDESVFQSVSLSFVYPQRPFGWVGLPVNFFQLCPSATPIWMVEEVRNHLTLTPWPSNRDGVEALRRSVMIKRSIFRAITGQAWSPFLLNKAIGNWHVYEVTVRKVLRGSVLKNLWRKTQATVG
ncbi:uncharacterized protein G2W53_022482 [Senna tora]|uniref:Uncharacterized protein n=1 Tax=Senna tora TaxID=362788 RepID=A0A834TLA5_9FABA|nr:uncharacterized protein G2W53_022482 [Senna tora]